MQDSPEKNALIDPVTGEIVDQETGRVVHVPTSEQAEEPKVVLIQKCFESDKTGSDHSGRTLSYYIH